MKKIKSFGETQKKTESKEARDKIEQIDTERYSLFFLYNGDEININSNRAIGVASKFIRKNYLNFQSSKGFRLSDLLQEANRKVVELGFDNIKIELAAFYYPKDESEETFFVLLGSPSVYTFSHDKFTKLSVSKSKHLFGEKELGRKDLLSFSIKNNKAPIFLCSAFFLELFSRKKKDILKILNQKDLPSQKASMLRVMKTQNASSSYFCLKRIQK